MNVLEARRRLLGAGVYKKTVTGNPAIAQGSLARMYPGITMQGWTEQNSTTGAQLFDISNIKTYSGGNIIEKSEAYAVDGNDIVVTNNIRNNIPGVNIPVDASQENIFVTYTTDSSGKYIFFSFIYTDGTKSTQDYYNANSHVIPLVADEGKTIQSINLGVGDYEGDISYTLSEIMVNYGSTALPYEPYTGGKPSPSPEYPQEIVSAGKYNEDTQKWEYEITIANAQTDATKNQTVLLTSDRPLTKWDKLEKRDGQWGWVYKSAEIVLDGSEDETISLYVGLETEGNSFAVNIPDSVSGYQTSLCDKYRNINGSWNSDHKDEYAIYSDHMNVINKARYFRPPSTEVETVEQWKTWLSGNPLTLWYQTSSETFTPLATAEQEQMNNLYTYRPTTVLSNQQDCEMALTYKTRKSMEVTA